MRLLGVVGLLALTLSLNAQCEQLVWSDEFDGSTLDLSTWGFDLGDGCPNLCGWGNNELQFYTNEDENVFLSDGNLHIRANFEAGGDPEWTSARIVTRDLQTFKSGRIEARIQMPEGQGFWPAFWLLPETREYGGWPLSGEIDVTEVIGNDVFTNHGTLHYGPKWPNNQLTGATVSVPQSLADGFHTYAIEWEHDEIRWYLDGQLFSVKTPEDQGTFPWRFDQDFHIILNLAVGGWFPGFPDETTPAQADLIVDYVRVYHLPEMAIITGRPYSFLGDEVPYNTKAVDGMEYQWSTDGGTIVSGGNSADVVVSWDFPGVHDLNLTIGSGECQSTITKSIRVGNECELVMSDNETHYGVHWSAATGAVSLDPLPSPNEVNGSSVSTRWTREGTTGDFVRFTIDGITDATPIAEGERTLALKTFTNAPAGTTLELRLMNEEQSGGSVFGGSYITLQGQTTVSYEWEQVYFTVTSAPNPTVDPTEINQLQMRMLSAQPLGYLIHTDDPTLIAVDCVPVGVAEFKEIEGTLALVENTITLSNSSADFMEVYDAGGRLIGTTAVAERSATVEVFAPGVYIVHLVAVDGVRTQKLIKP
ncbi:family 16 glycosylhydrolase [Sanyastnella coralliicola]|uniref:family 16 glycosylhydrolase n=1 Tax=Sanyastnella coralliicola TaxID=3069118 RepID=UPI0027B8F22A|nr:family 16 glycosylhydrolase [Longitalea sp. SCSIO 12813]